MICARSTLAWRGQDGALWIDRHGVYSWMRLRPRDTLQRERQRENIMQSISTALSALILNVRLKSPKLTDRLRNSVSSEFQTIGPATEKARRPNVILRQRGTISWCWLADRRCRLLTAVTGVQVLRSFDTLSAAASVVKSVSQSVSQPISQSINGILLQNW